jgi:F420-non-reducing hydrogenase iron-sulfur subunit
MAISQIMLLLGEKPLSTRASPQSWGLNPSDVSRHMNASSRHGLVKYDTANKCYASWPLEEPRIMDIRKKYGPHH